MRSDPFSGGDRLGPLGEVVAVIYFENEDEVLAGAGDFSRDFAVGKDGEVGVCLPGEGSVERVVENLFALGRCETGVTEQGQERCGGITGREIEQVLQCLGPFMGRTRGVEQDSREAGEDDFWVIGGGQYGADRGR